MHAPCSFVGRHEPKCRGLGRSSADGRECPYSGTNALKPVAPCRTCAVQCMHNHKEEHHGKLHTDRDDPLRLSGAGRSRTGPGAEVAGQDHQAGGAVSAGWQRGYRCAHRCARHAGTARPGRRGKQGRRWRHDRGRVRRQERARRLHAVLHGQFPLLHAPIIFKRAAYQWDKDFLPISSVSFTPIVLLSNPTLPAKTIQEVIALAKKEPGKLRDVQAARSAARPTTC